MQDHQDLHSYLNEPSSYLTDKVFRTGMLLSTINITHDTVKENPAFSNTKSNKQHCETTILH